MRKDNNIFWQKYRLLTNKSERLEFLAQIKKECNVSYTLFLYHCKMNIQNMDFKYIRLYGKLLGLTLNQIDEWTTKQIQDTQSNPKRKSSKTKI